jgi:hypothetical protein
MKPMRGEVTSAAIEQGFELRVSTAVTKKRTKDRGVLRFANSITFAVLLATAANAIPLAWRQ